MKCVNKLDKKPRKNYVNIEHHQSYIPNTFQVQEFVYVMNARKINTLYEMY